MNKGMAQKMDTREGRRKSDNIYENADAVRDKITMETENSSTMRIQPPQHTESRSVKIRNYRAAVVCLVLLCVLLLTAVIVLCVQDFTNIDLFQTKGKNIMEERDQLLTKNDNLTDERDQLLTKNKILTDEGDQLLTKNKNLTDERDQLLTKITSLSRDRDWLLNKNTNLTNERHELISKNDNLIKQRDQLNQKRNEMLNNFDEMDGWNYHEFSYYYISSESRSWTESRRYCTEKGADLINNIEEQDFVMKDKREFWIGLTDIDGEGVWTWVDGSTLTSGLWASGEPNGQRGENCALTYLQGWADYPCSSAFKWICEKSIPPTILP